MIGVNADEWPFYLPYQTDRTMKCTLPRTGSFGTVINHAVLLIGYTETEWIIKNSWGTAWGMKGIIYISRNPANNCGVGHYVFTLDYPLPIPKL
jgi:C1A family cysteine protease